MSIRHTTVTLLFTDIEGSTVRWEYEPDAMAEALRRHDALLREAIHDADGQVFKTGGDSFRATFASARDALRAAIQAQRSLAAERWSAYSEGLAPLRVRMAIHTGETLQQDGDHFGAAVNRVARLESVARGGQILLTSATERLLRGQLPEGARLRDLGEHRLRDLRLSEHVFQVITPGMADAPSTLRDAGPASSAPARDATVIGLGAITPQRLRAALAVIRAGRPVEDEALLSLAQLRGPLAELGDGQTPEHRGRALAALLHGRIRGRLAELRGTDPANMVAEEGREETLRAARADFVSGDVARQRWSILHLRFVSRSGILMRELPAHLRAGRSTLGRRLRAGLHALALDLIEAEVAAGSTDQEAAATGPRSRSNLPAARDRFVGRGKDLAELARLQDAERLVTLVGPGGVGKTRLALELGRRTDGRMPDEVWLLELAGLREDAAIEPALAALLEITEQDREALEDRIVRRLGERRLLLLLDNCEHLLEGCAALAGRLLDRCPGVRILATSRAPLSLPGEVLWRVEPLSRPGAGRGPRPVPESESERLLIDRLLARRPGLRLNEEDVEAVRRICHRLEGLPLALELAAARAGSLPLPALAARIDDRPVDVAGGVRGLPERHRSLRASIDWSFRLLSPREKRCLERASVFARGFTLEAAQEICAGAADAGWPAVDRLEVLDLLSGLVEQSLLQPPELSGADIRYHMLAALRGYGRQRVGAHGEEAEAALELRHAEHFKELALRTGGDLSDTHKGEALAVLDRERENLLAAIETLRRRGRRNDALAMAAALRHYWSIKGSLTEGRRLLEALLEESEGEPRLDARVRLAALEGAGHLARRQSDYAAARARLGAGLDLARSIGDRQGEARVLRLLGHLADEEARYPDAERLYRQALTICREDGDRWGEAALLNNLGLLELNQGRVDTARGPLDESLARFRDLDETWAIGIVQLNRGNAGFDSGDLALAERCYAESLAIAEGLGDRAGIAAATSAQAKLAMRRGDLAEADARYRSSIRELRALGDLQKIAEWLEARALLDRAAERPARACRLLAAALRLREEIGAPLLAKASDEHAELAEELSAALGRRTYTRERARGASRSWHRAVEDALG